MVSFDQNSLYIIVGIILIVIIILAVFMRRRGSKKGPSNPNQYLADEAKNKKIKIVERAEGFSSEIPLYKLGPEDKMNTIRETTSELQHKNAYYNSKVEERVERLENQEKQVNLQKQLKTIYKKDHELNRTVKHEKKK